MTDAVARLLGQLIRAGQDHARAMTQQEPGRLESESLVSARQDVMAGLEYLATALIAECSFDGFAFIEIDVKPGRMTTAGMAFAFVLLGPMEAVIQWTDDRREVRYEIRFGTRNAAGQLELCSESAGKLRQRFENRPRRKSDWAIVVSGQRDLTEG